MGKEKMRVATSKGVIKRTHRPHPRRLHWILLLVTSLTFVPCISANVCPSSSCSRLASLTCTFSEDVRENRRDFKIVDEHSVTALKCVWRSDESYCHVGAGYRYNWTVTDSVTIQKPYDTQLPICSCYIVSADKSDHERPCSVEDMTVEQADQNNQTAGDRQLLVYGAKDRAVCDIPPTDVNSTVTLTCYLPADVSVNKRNFIVYHSVTTQAPVAVINATWHEGQYLFSLTPGFGVEGSQSDGRAFTFYILQVSKGHNGMYSCRPDGYHDGDIKGCELVLNKSGSESVDSPEQKENSSDCSNHSETTDIYLILFIIAVVFIGILVVCLIFVLRRKSNSCKCGKDKNEHEPGRSTSTEQTSTQQTLLKRKVNDPIN